MRVLFLIITGLLLSSSLFAKRFSSQYAEFELPTGWDCTLEGSEWVCQSSNKDRMKEAIIIMAAKIRGEQDTLDSYQDYLKNQKSFTLPGGRRQISEPKYVNVKEYNAHRWIDALHMASEVPGFYTRYLATVKEDLGVAVTFSVSKDHYNLYQSIFDNVVASLRVFRQKKLNLASGFKRVSDDLLENSSVIPASDERFAINQKSRKDGGSSSGEDDNFLFILLGVAVVGFFIWKKKKAAGKKKKKG